MAPSQSTLLWRICVGAQTFPRQAAAAARASAAKRFVGATGQRSQMSVMPFSTALVRLKTPDPPRQSATGRIGSRQWTT